MPARVYGSLFWMAKVKIVMPRCMFFRMFGWMFRHIFNQPISKKLSRDIISRCIQHHVALDIRTVETARNCLVSTGCVAGGDAPCRRFVPQRVSNVALSALDFWRGDSPGKPMGIMVLNRDFTNEITLNYHPPDIDYIKLSCHI